MKKLTAVFAALTAIMIPAFAYADIIAPGTVVVDGRRINIIPVILILVVITIARSIIVKAVRNKKAKDEEIE